MTVRLLNHLVVPVSGLLLTTVFAVRTGTLEKLPSLWTSGGTQPATRSPEPEPADTSKLSMPSHVIAEGRVVAYPGAEAVLGTEAAGRIVHLNVQEKSVVRQGDLIAELNEEDLKAEEALSLARVMEAEADIRFFDREYRRDSSLIARNAGTSQNLDVNRRGLDGARARRAAALAERDRIVALRNKTRIIAPFDGVITARHVQPGETIDLAARIVTMVDLNRIRIEAEVDEFDTSRVTLGAEVKITAEGFPGASWKGRVEEIPDSVIARRIRPEDPGRPIDARVLPVKIMFSGPTPLKLGQRVEIEILEDESH